jgi:hypothetical protein
VLWPLVAVAVVVLLAVAIAVQQRHATDLVSTLAPLIGQRLSLGISTPGTQVVVVGRFVGVIDAVDPATRWVTFQWIENDDLAAPGNQFAPIAASITAHLAENGVIADRIYWVEAEGGRRIRLT